MKYNLCCEGCYGDKFKLYWLFDNKTQATKKMLSDEGLSLDDAFIKCNQCGLESRFSKAEFTTVIDDNVKVER